MPSARLQKFLRCSRSLFFITGSLALAYVGLTLVEAKLYQASAKQTLENQIQARKKTAVIQPGVIQPGLIQSRPAAKQGDVLGRMDIPRLGMSIAVLQGASSRNLRLGAGHIEGTPLPGESGNSALAGHRDTFFRGLKDVRTNDEIQFQTATGLFRYAVDWVKIVEPGDVTVLQPSSVESALTLVTCYPFYFLGPAPRRFVVRAHRY
jgi:LPXTG-site transpeptidase (sortase) family protein